jgi:hypothetical protein
VEGKNSRMQLGPSGSIYLVRSRGVVEYCVEAFSCGPIENEAVAIRRRRTVRYCSQWLKTQVEHTELYKLESHILVCLVCTRSDRAVEDVRRL